LANGRVVRCEWAKNELAIQYHDEEWGVPVHEDLTFFEFLILEGAQAGPELGYDPAQAENYARRSQDSIREGGEVR